MTSSSESSSKKPKYNLKKIGTTFLQAVVTIALLYWIFHDPEKRQKMLEALSQANLWWLIPGVISFGLVLIFSTFRWSLLMRIQKIHLSWWRVWQLVMIGMFFNLFLLGSVGGDVLKIFYAIREEPSKKTAIFSSIVFDRLVGMFSLMILTAIICGIAFSDFWSQPMTRGLLLTVMVIFGIFLLCVLLSLIVQHYRLWDYLPEWLPGHRFIIDVAMAFSAYAGDGPRLLQTLVYSFLANFSLFGTALFSTLAYASMPGAPSVMAIIKALPIVNTISALPISLSGIGVREGLFQTVLHTLYGTPPSLAILISLSMFSLTIVWSLIGGAVYLCYRPSKTGSTKIEPSIENVGSVIEEAELISQHLETELEKEVEI